MSDPLTWSIPLVRWAGTRVRVHAFLLIFVASKVLGAAWEKEAAGLAVKLTAAWLVLLLVALAAKIAMQIWVGERLGLDREEVCVWPLGDLGRAGLSASERSGEGMTATASGLAVNLALAVAMFVAVWASGAWMMLWPFGHPTWGGAPIRFDGKPAAAFTPVWWIGQFGYLNFVLFVANLIPALPLDGGRIYRAILATRTRDGLIGPWTARSCALVLVVVGLARWLYWGRPGSTELFSIALAIEWMVRMEARSFEEGGFFDDGVFGYDFSQGYTSLDAGAATVRPPREGALKRWRRNRSEERRRRREAEEAAEESQMDAILEKLHREGRSALSDDEQRFLMRVSARYKKRVQGS